LRKGKFPLTLEGGASPTFLSRHDFGEKDFGDNVQFTSHPGVNWDITQHFNVDWRFQHMSNAGLSGHNPGLNLLIMSASYRF
jgi:lipid A 3-O-deacylase